MLNKIFKKRVNNKVDNKTKSVYMLGCLPDSNSFLLEADLILRHYETESKYVQYKTNEDGTVYAQKIDGNTNKEISMRELDNIFKTAKVRPLEISRRVYITPYGIKLTVEIIDGSIIKGTINFESETDRELCVLDDYMKNLVLDDITTNNELENYTYWRNTRFTTK